jgi:hypothetical protein
MAMYLAANKSLPLVADHPGSGFYTTALRDKNDVRRFLRGLRLRLLHAGTRRGDALRQCGAVELFTCWEGDQALAPNHRGAITLGGIATGALKWYTREFFTIQSAT